MDGYESLYEKNQREDRERKARRELEDARFEQEQAERSADRARQEAEQARRYSQSLRHEYEEEREQYAEELAERAAEVKRLKAEQKLLITLLRRLSVTWKGSEDTLTIEQWQAQYTTALKEAQELIRLIDLAALNG